MRVQVPADETLARALQKEFPKNPQVSAMLLELNIVENFDLSAYRFGRPQQSGALTICRA